MLRRLHHSGVAYNLELLATHSAAHNSKPKVVTVVVVGEQEKIRVSGYCRLNPASGGVARVGYSGIDMLFNLLSNVEFYSA